jgi:hypothetical protein
MTPGARRREAAPQPAVGPGRTLLIRSPHVVLHLLQLAGPEVGKGLEYLLLGVHDWGAWGLWEHGEGVGGWGETH